MQQILHKKTGFYYPQNSGSQNAIKEAYYLKDYGGLPTPVDFKNKVVMDCGCHIGTFARRALEEGAAKVHCYEPFKSCFDSIQMNLPKDKAETYNVAVSTKAGLVDFHYREARLEASSLVHKGANQKRWNYQTMQVQTVDFWSELERIRPSILKIDIEGEEWNIFENKVLPDYVEALFIEVHGLYSKGFQHGIDFIQQIFPNGVEVGRTFVVPFKSKPDKITNVSALYIKNS